jgi:hypothetical protein
MASGRDKRRVTKPVKRTQKQTAPEENSDAEIWSSMLDGRYAVTVHRLSRSRGELNIRDGSQHIHRREVTLMYGAIFGPDIDDVATWQEIATTVVDGLKEPPEAPTRHRSAGGPVA